MSVTTNRVALAPIKDTHLNSTSSSNSSTPLKDKKKRPSILFNISKHTFSTSEIKRRRQELFMKSFTLPNSATTLNKKYSPLRSLSFSDSRSTSSTSSSPTIKPRANKRVKTITNDTAGLAATKLKLKLQLALYKIQQQKQSKGLTRVYHVDETTTIKFSSATSLKLLSPPNSAKTSSFSSPSRQKSPIYLTSQAKAISSLPTPPQAPINYFSSININLETKAKLLASEQNHKESTRPLTLSNIAQRKQSNQKSSKLRLFQIKKNSIFYTNESQGKKLPLIQGELQSKPKPLHVSSSLDILKHMPSTTSPKQQVNNTTSFILPYAAAAAASAASAASASVTSASVTRTNASSLPSILLNPPSTQSFNHATNLPSINKILRTPIKKANSTRQLVQQHTTKASRLNTVTDDTTIDEDNDMTIINNTTMYNNTTIEQNDTTVPERNYEDNDYEEDNCLTRKDILSSSPLSNPFGTPNSFSVARSLLQLGGHKI